MPNFKPLDYSPRFLAVDLSHQLVPGTFEYALHHLLEHEIDLTEIECALSQRRGRCLGLPPRVLLKIDPVRLLPWHREQRGRSSGRVATTCSFIAMCGDSQPRTSRTLAGFVSGLGDEIAHGVHAGAVGLRSPRTDRARDVCHRRGEAALQCEQGQERHARGLRAAGGEDRGPVAKMLARHRDNDEREGAGSSERKERQIERLQARGDAD